MRIKPDKDLSSPQLNGKTLINKEGEQADTSLVKVQTDHNRQGKINA